MTHNHNSRRPGLLERLNRRFKLAFFPPSRQTHRYQYKDTWIALSQTIEQAQASVLGSQSEEDIQATAIRTRHLLEKTVGLKIDDVILEIGCGFGRVGQQLAPLCATWIGCDVSSNMLEFARERLAGFDNVRLIEISGFDLGPIADESVDLVYCTVVFMHLDEWDRYNYLLEARRVLRPGGRVFVDNFNLCSDEGWHIFDQHRLLLPRVRPAHVAKSSTPQEIEIFMRRAGFNQIRIAEDAAWIQGYAIK